MSTPIVRPIEIPPPEKFQSFSPIRTASAAEDPDSDASSPPAATPIDVAPSFELSTPPRPSLAPPRSNLRPELSGPPSSSENETESIDIASPNRQSDVPLSLNVTKPPRVPGAWAATPAPARSQTHIILVPAGQVVASTIQFASSDFLHRDPNLHCSTPLRRFPAQAHFPYEHLRHLGGWFSTPGSLRRKSLLKVHFDNMTSNSAISDRWTACGRVDSL